MGGPASGDMVQAATPVYTIEGPFCSSFAFASSRQVGKGFLSDQLVTGAASSDIVQAAT